MRYDVMKAYRRLCELYGWPQSFEGLRMFARQVRMGYRSIWLGEDHGRDRIERMSVTQGAADVTAVTRSDANIFCRIFRHGVQNERKPPPMPQTSRTGGRKAKSNNHPHYMGGRKECQAYERMV